MVQYGARGDPPYVYMLNMSVVGGVVSGNTVGTLLHLLAYIC
jgi:hypothetical protein